MEYYPKKPRQWRIGGGTHSQARGITIWTRGKGPYLIFVGRTRREGTKLVGVKVDSTLIVRGGNLRCGEKTNGQDGGGKRGENEKTPKGGGLKEDPEKGGKKL